MLYLKYVHTFFCTGFVILPGNGLYSLGVLVNGIVSIFLIVVAGIDCLSGMFCNLSREKSMNL